MIRFAQAINLEVNRILQHSFKRCLNNRTTLPGHLLFLCSNTARVKLRCLSRSMSRRASNDYPQLDYRSFGNNPNRIFHAALRHTFVTQLSHHHTTLSHHPTTLSQNPFSQHCHTTIRTTSHHRHVIVSTS